MAFSVTSSARTAMAEAMKRKTVSASPTGPCMPCSPASRSSRPEATRAQARANLQPVVLGDPGSAGPAAPPRARPPALAALLWQPPPGRRAAQSGSKLFGRAQRARWRAHRGGQLPGINLLPGARTLADEIAAARIAINLRILGAGRHDPTLAQSAGGHQQASARARDHLVGGRQMLAGVVDDRTHTFGDGLILEVDALDAAVDGIALLGGAVHAPVVARICRHPPTAEPVGRIRQKLVAAARAADRPTILEGRLRQRHRRGGALPPKEEEHRVGVVERHPGTCMHVTAELAVRRLRPKWKQEI